MAATPGHTADAVAELQALRDKPYRFSLFAALRAIERAYENAPRLGESRRPADDPVRLFQAPYLTFAPAEVAGFHIERDKPVLEGYSFGMFGPNGALPLHLTEVAFQRRRQMLDPALNDFVNLLQHRLMGLFYRAWADTDPVTNFDRPDSDRFRTYLGALIGLGSSSGWNRDGVSDYAKFQRVAQLASHTRSAESLEDLLADYFELKVQVVSFVGGWLDIASNSRTRLGARNDSGQLGLGTTLGAASWQTQHQFEIVLGPLALPMFENFLPGAPGITELAALVRLYTNDEWSWQLRLLLEAGAVPGMSLGSNAQLGWTTWLGGRKEAANDVVIRGDAFSQT
jgi:type VI secretion system protein ImpH